MSVIHAKHTGLAGDGVSAVQFPDWDAAHLGSPLSVVQGATLVSDVVALNFVSGATVVDAGGGIADVSITSPAAPTIRTAAGVPTGAPSGTELPIAFDTTATTGGLYCWSGAAWVFAAPIPPVVTPD